MLMLAAGIEWVRLGLVVARAAGLPESGDDGLLRERERVSLRACADADVISKTAAPSSVRASSVAQAELSLLQRRLRTHRPTHTPHQLPQAASFGP